MNLKEWRFMSTWLSSCEAACHSGFSLDRNCSVFSILFGHKAFIKGLATRPLSLKGIWVLPWVRRSKEVSGRMREEKEGGNTNTKQVEVSIASADPQVGGMVTQHATTKLKSPNRPNHMQNATLHLANQAAMPMGLAHGHGSHCHCHYCHFTL